MVNQGSPQRYESFFNQATGNPPYPYQARLADGGLPATLEIPTGAGKTAAVIIAWLFRLTQARIPDAPRSLIFMLPMRTLVEQTWVATSLWLENLGLGGQVRVIVLMGGDAASAAELNEWRRNPQQPTIVIGTVDSTLSRALVRGYAQPRTTYPIDFARVCDDAHWVIDEVQLAQQATATTRQLAAFREELRTLHSGGLTCMSATIPQTPLDTIDNPYRSEATVTLSDEDRTGPLRARLDATRAIRSIAEPTIAGVAQAISREHRPETLTLAIVNTVATATDLLSRVRKQGTGADLILLHSRFRGVERAEFIKALTTGLPPEGRIVISTQVVEAGVDLDAATLFTEVAPWSSVCQRAGRCNRAGKTENAQLIWFPALSGGKSGPYDPVDLESSAAALADLEGMQVTSEDLLQRDVDQSQDLLTILRRRDFTRLFDTSPDLSGMDIDIAMFIRPTEDLDLTVAWIDPEDIVGGRIANTPSEPWRCSVPLGGAREWLKNGPSAWAYDPPSGKWQPVRRVNDLKPNRLVLVDRNGGGYLPDMGFAPKSKEPIKIEPPGPLAEPVFEGASEGIAQDEGSTRQIGWQRLELHLEEAHQQATALLDRLAPTELNEGVRAAVASAAQFHDLGKSHGDWQRGLLEANAVADLFPTAEGPWAKSPGNGRLVVRAEGRHIRRGFRHELVSVLHLRTEAGKQALTRVGVPEEHHPLAIYLAGAHHGHLRIQPRDPLAEGHDGASLMGLSNGEILPAITLGEHVFPQTEVDLSVFGMGSPASWSRAALQLFDRWGPFRLAWFELIVRMADWRSSAGDSLPEGK